ncbi:lipocalin-like domain-containing protein [Methylobacterium sp. A54F]
MNPSLVAVPALAAALAATAPSRAEPANQVLGTWRMMSARIDPDGRNLPAYGTRPNGLLVFTPDMRFIEVLTDPDVPRFASGARGQGTAEENRAAMAGSIGFFGTYTVDPDGAFSGNRVDGSTFPNWVGDVRTTGDLQLVVDGDRMRESFHRPDGTRVAIDWQRVR